MKADKIRKSLVYSYIDGIFASVMMGLRDNFITPFGIALGATTGQIGLLTAVPNLAASLAQIKTADVTESVKSRKKVITIAVFAHLVMFLPMLLIPFVLKGRGVEFLILFYTLHLSFGNFAAPPWGSLISEYLPANKRGKYFGFRNKTLGFVSVASAFLGGFLLYRFAKWNIFIGYAVLFLIALFTRLASWYYLNKMYEPPFRIDKDARFGFFEFVANIKKSNFTKFVFYAAAMIFCVNLAAPFFAVYMLKNLSMNYLTYTVVVMSSTITTLLVMDRWGKKADLFGNIKVLKTCSFFVPFVPMLWLFSTNTVYLILIQVIAGFFWSGFNLAMANFIYDAVSPPKRTRCIAYFNVINGAAIFLGAILGGYIANFLPPLFGYKLLTLFLLSGALRLFVAVFSFSLKEVRPVKKTSSFKLLQETIGLNLGLIRD